LEDEGKENGETADEGRCSLRRNGYAGRESSSEGNFGIYLISGPINQMHMLKIKAMLITHPNSLGTYRSMLIREDMI